MSLIGESRRRAELANRFRSQVPPAPPGDGPPRPPRRLEVFGTGPTWVQLTWSALGPGPVTVRAGEGHVDVDTDGGPGAVVVGGLVPDAAVDVELSGAGVPGSPMHLRTRTLPCPPGELLHRIATISDAHIGATTTGYLHTITEKPLPPEPAAVRCARAALADARAWGADELVVKGDLVDHSQPDWWATAAGVLAEAALPVSLVAGNHEFSKRGDGDPVAGLAAHGHALTTPVGHLDRPGVLVVLVDTTVPGHNTGRIAHVSEAVVDLAAGAGTPVLVAMHHQLMRFRFPTYLPIGIPGPESQTFLDALGAASPRALVTSGHTHRHRRRDHGPVTITEVGSTKDFPGTWAGYEVYEGGIVQTVRRIGEPSCIRWTDHTRRAAAGIWQHWSPGRLADRCFTRRW